MKRVLLLIPNGAEVYETSAFFDVLGWANESGDTPIEVVTAGTTREVRCTFGLRVLPDRLLGEVDPADFDALAVPGGFEQYGFYEDAYGDGIAGVIRAFDAAAKPIASICVGALPLANSGILKGKRATTYRLGGSVRPAQLAAFGADVQAARIVRAGHVTTSTSPATAVEVALALVADLTGEANAAHVRGLMGFDDSARGPAPGD